MNVKFNIIIICIVGKSLIYIIIKPKRHITDIELSILYKQYLLQRGWY